MINIITGTPGSGKSYLAVKLILEKYFDYDKKSKSFNQKKDLKHIVFFSNIDGLKLPHKSLDEIFKTHNIGFNQFFTVPYQEKLHVKYPNIVYIIDECQQYIPSGFRNKDVVYYFDYHRHFGDSIFLITQDYTKICKNINVLCELEYRAVKSTFSVFGEFRYNIKSGGTIFKRKSTKKDKKIFALYRSFQGLDQEKHSNPLKYIIIVLCFSFLFLGYLFYDFVGPSPSPASPSPASPSPASPSPASSSPASPSLASPSLASPPDRIHRIKIKNFMTISSHFIFECPFSGRWINTKYEFPDYRVKQIGRSYYILISLSELNEIKKFYYAISSNYTPKDSLDSKESYIHVLN